MDKEYIKNSYNGRIGELHYTYSLRMRELKIKVYSYLTIVFISNIFLLGFMIFLSTNKISIDELKEISKDVNSMKEALYLNTNYINSATSQIQSESNARLNIKSALKDSIILKLKQIEVSKWAIHYNLSSSTITK